MDTRLPRVCVLVVDDESDARTVLSELLRRCGYDVVESPDAADALRKCETWSPDLVVTDLVMPGVNGIELVRRLHQQRASIPVIVLTGQGAIATAVDAIRAGAAEYMMKPVDSTLLLARLTELLATAPVSAASVRDSAAPVHHGLVGDSPPMRRVAALIEQVAPSRATVLITGPTGTGKELVASALHQHSLRSRGPFLKVHCAALSEGVLESELFGHERGAFTGAHARRDGRFQLADGGTLFLDEIGDVSPAVQVKLLRFLQDYELERVGGTETIRVDVRVIAATNRDLPARVASGHFREDLYYRLNVVGIEMPCLRERRSDIPALVAHFVAVFAEANGRTILGATSEAMALLVAYDWPGNVRELANVIEGAVVRSAGNVIGVESLAGTGLVPMRLDRPFAGGGTLAQIERHAIVETLRSTGGSKSRAAAILGISTRTIHTRLRAYSEAHPSGVDVVDFQALGPSAGATSLCSDAPEDSVRPF